MKKTFSKKKSAFSLIELSIVLIVIGLLIAGITGGASLIKSSELRSVMGEARGYAVAVNAFYSQFNMLPGDYDVVLAAGKGGNKDGQIGYFTSATGSTTLTASESANAWMQLKTIGAVDTISGTSLVEASVATPVTFGTNAPASKIKSSGWVFNYFTGAAQNTVVLTGAIVATTTAGTAITDATFSSSITATNGAIVPTDALSIDSKIDDGVANTGKVRGVSAAGVTTCYSTATYTTATNTKVCALSYQVDVNS